MNVAELFSSRLLETLAETGALHRSARLLESIEEFGATTINAIGAMEVLTYLAATNAESNDLFEQLVKLRDEIVQAQFEEDLKRLGEIASENPETAERLWLEVISEAMIACYELSAGFARADIGFEPAGRQELVTLIDAARNGFWRQREDLAKRFAEDERISDRQRAIQFAIVANYAANWRGDFEAAEDALARADTLDEACWVSSLIRGSLIKKQGEDNALATEAYQRAADQSENRVADPLVFLGDLLLDEDDIPGAERLYTDASRCAWRPDEGYAALIKLAGLRDGNERRDAQIADLIRKGRLLAQDKDQEYRLLLGAAETAKSCQDFDSFDARLAEAVALAPERFDAYLHQGYAALERSDLDIADTAFERAFEIAPDLPEVNWARANLANEREDWDRLLAAAAAVFEAASEYSGSIRGLLENAAVKVRPGDEALALRFLQFLRDKLGPDYDGFFHNQVGNLHYYHGRYDAAAECFRQAISADPESARFRANLAIGLESVRADNPERLYSEALATARKAVELDPSSTEFGELVDRISRRLEFAERFGPAAIYFLPDNSRIRVSAGWRPIAQAVEAEELRPVTVERIGAFREEVARTAGFTLPGIRFTLLEGDAFENRLMVEIAGTVVSDVELSADDDMLQHVQDTLSENLSRVLGHAGIRAFAAQCGGDVARDAEDPARLNEMTVLGRELLARDGQLDGAALMAAPSSERDRFAMKDATCRAGEIALAWNVRNGNATDLGPSLQEEVHRQTGVLVPVLVPETDPSLPEGSAHIRIDNEVVAAGIPATQEAIQDVLIRHADRLLDPVAIRFHLLKLDDDDPVIAEVARALLSENRIFEGLRERLAKGESVQHFLGSIEALLLDKRA